MQFARRIEKLPPYLFTEISRKIAEKRAQGVDVVTFAIGDPDIPTPPHIVDALVEAARDPANHRYPETEGLPELRRAIAEWYERRFGLTFDPEREVLPLIGSKEGIGHIAPSPGPPPPTPPPPAVAELAFFESAVAFARRHDIAVCHDGPYSEVAFDGYRPVSFLPAPGARAGGGGWPSLSENH